jgi:hypothetical protein
MPCQNLDATILLEQPPDIEIRAGLVYVTDRVGSVTIRRCFRVSTFVRLVRSGSEAVAKWQVDQLDKVGALGRH